MLNLAMWFPKIPLAYVSTLELARGEPTGELQGRMKQQPLHASMVMGKYPAKQDLEQLGKPRWPLLCACACVADLASCEPC